MKNVYYSYCCGKYVERNSECPNLVEQGVLPVKGYHCSRCKKPLTVYGNPIREEDKQKLKNDNKKVRKDNGIRGSKIEHRKDGFYLINELYPYGDFSDGYERMIEKWVLFDYYANFVACIKVTYSDGYMPVLNEKLKKAKLCAVRIGGFEHYGLNSINELKNRPDILRNQLESTGWKFDKNGKIR